MREEDVKMCVRHGADIIGFVVDYPRPVPWGLSARAARALAAAADGSAETCIVTGGTPDKIIKLASEIKPDYIQLHGGENLEDTALLVDILGKRGVKIIKTIFPDTPDLEKNALDFCGKGVHALLFDPRTPDNAAAGGTADISAYIRLKNAVNCPVILAGGIKPGNAARIIKESGAEIIDLMTGVERFPGIKDEEKVILLFKEIKGE
jgi:phosphoribosylanthranilate isomerase